VGKYLRNRVEWSKYEIVHFGRKNEKEAFCLNGERLQSSEIQRDLGVLVHKLQKANMQLQQVIR